MGLTMLRLLLLPVFLYAVLAGAGQPAGGYRWAAVGIFVLMAATDKLDGYLARRLNQTTRLGALLDPVADKLLVDCTVILLSFPQIAPEGFIVPMWVVVAVYGKDVLIAVGAIAVLALAGKVSIAARPLGKLSTVLQLMMLMVVLTAPVPQAARFAVWHPLAVGLWWAVAGVAALACIDYVIVGTRQYVQSRKARAQ